MQKYEAESMTRSDAQGIVDAEFLQTYGPGWTTFSDTFVTEADALAFN